MASLVKRGNAYYVQYRLHKKLIRKHLGTESLQIAKEKLRQFESAQLRGDETPLPTRTPIPEVVNAYVQHLRRSKTAKSAQTDIYYLRDAFGPICEGLTITSRKPSALTKKKPPRHGQDGRRRPPTIEAPSFEQITTPSIAAFIGGIVETRQLAPKTANRHREILCRLFNWAMQQHGIRMPHDKNPAAKVQRYRERASEIRFLTVAQIDQQLDALKFKPQLQTMVATLIYAGLRREELLWLTTDDIDLQSGPNGTIRIHAKTIGEERWQPKTKINRAVPISQALRSFLLKYKPPASDHGWYFPSPQGKRWDTDNFSRDLRAANTEFNLPWACLDYRHTFGSQLAMAGRSLYKIAAILGNSPEICRRHYAALLPESLANIVDFDTPQPPLRLADDSNVA